MDLHLAYVLVGSGIGGLLVAVLGAVVSRVDPDSGGRFVAMVTLLLASAIGYWRIRGHNRMVDDWHRAHRLGKEGIDRWLELHYRR